MRRKTIEKKKKKNWIMPICYDMQKKLLHAKEKGAGERLSKEGKEWSCWWRQGEREREGEGKKKEAGAWAEGMLQQGSAQEEEKVEK